MQCTKMIDFIIDETTNDFSSGEMLLKILTAEKERLGKLVLEDGLSSRRSSDIAWRRGVALPGSQSGNTLKPEAETLSNETNAWQSTSPVQVGWYMLFGFHLWTLWLSDLHSSCVICIIRLVFKNRPSINHPDDFDLLIHRMKVKKLALIPGTCAVCAVINLNSFLCLESIGRNSISGRHSCLRNVCFAVFVKRVVRCSEVN